MAQDIPVTIEVRPEYKNGDYKWKHDSPKKSWYGFLCLHSPNDEDYILTFVLYPPTGRNLRFAGHGNSFWSSKGFSCPVDGEQADGFTPISCTDTVLVVRNENRSFWWYRYRLDFIDKDGPVTWDPIIENQDGNHFYIGLALKIVLALGAALGIFGVVRTLLP